jgi:hypothetical protein
VGIDPGKQGAIALATSPYRVIIADFPLLQGQPDREKLYSFSALARGGIAWIETPQFRPSDMRRNIFSAGTFYECWQFPLILHGCSIAEVPASTWKREMGLFGTGKDGAIALAKQIFPTANPYLQRKKDHDRAEALLILRYALIQEGGELGKEISMDLY